MKLNNNGIVTLQDVISKKLLTDHNLNVIVARHRIGELFSTLSLDPYWGRNTTLLLNATMTLAIQHVLANSVLEPPPPQFPKNTYIPLKEPLCAYAETVFNFTHT